MPGFLLHVGAVVTCTHQGAVRSVPPVPPRVLVNGMAVLTATSQLLVVGCISAPTDVKAQWMNMSTRVLIGGQPALLQAPPTGPGNGVCLAAPATDTDADAVAGRGDADEGHCVMNVYVDFPFGIGPRGGTATTGYADHVRDMIEELLFTRPGERRNRPDFGCGLLDRVFEPNSVEVAAVLQVSAEAALQRWLGDLIVVDALTVTADEATLKVELRYWLIATGEQQDVVLDGSAVR